MELMQDNGKRYMFKKEIRELITNQHH